jgi:hypothetical protein
MPHRRSGRRERHASSTPTRATGHYGVVLLSQKKFKDLFELIEPADRNPVLESKVRSALGTAAAGLHYDEKAEAFLRDAIRLDPSAVEPGIQLARFLNGSKREAAERVINDVIAANPQSAELRRVKGEMLWSHGESNAAVHLFDGRSVRPAAAGSSRPRQRKCARGELRPRTKISIRYFRRFPTILWRITCAPWSKSSNSNMSQPIGFPGGILSRAVTKLALGQLEFGEGLLETPLIVFLETRRRRG